MKLSLRASIASAAILLCLALTAHAAERDWQQAWCEGKGITEHVLPDKTRVDCLTEDYAIEFDYGHKWAEAIGQSLYYGAATGKQPGIVLIIRDPAECRFIKRLRHVIRSNQINIQLWTIPLECGL